MFGFDLENPIRQEAAWMRRVQPGTRLLISLAGTFLIAAIDHHSPLTLIALVAITLVLGRGVSFRWITSHLLGLAGLALFFSLPLAWLGPGTPAGPLALRAEGIRLGLSILLKACAILTWNWVWLLGIGPRQWRHGARQIRVPARLAEVGWLMGASIGIVRRELRQMRLALRLRGGRITPGRRGYHLLANLLGMTLWRSSGHAGKIAVAKALRCEGPGESIPPLGWRQWGLVMATLAPLGLIAAATRLENIWLQNGWGYWI